MCSMPNSRPKTRTTNRGKERERQRKPVRKEMPLSATVFGALWGLGIQMYSNALRKLPYMRHPWEHVLGMGIGAVFMNQVAKWEDQFEEDRLQLLEKAKAANERRYFNEDED